MTVRLSLFGAPAIHDGGESFALPFERRNQLLAFLALKRAWVGRAELAAMLWPDQETKLAYANLRKILFRLQSLRWARGIESQDGALRFDVATDVFEFETALREKRIAEALPLRRGELLAGFDDGRSEGWTDWLGFERERLRLAWRDAALDRLAADIEPGEGVDLSARLLEADPLDEAALRAHMSWLAHSGQGARARRAYREFSDRLSEDLGLAPGAESKALHDSLGSAATARPPTTSASPSLSDNGFIGRSVELGRIAELLARDDCRMVSLIGPGGVGKTRLARRALHELAQGFADGVAFVSLEDAATAGEFGGLLAREIGVELAGGAEPVDQVARFLSERQMLLALDNFEQLAAHAPLLDRLLHACPGLKFIVTTRVRLAVASEWSLPIEGLPCPEIEDQDRIEAFDAVRLFVNAARRVEPALIPAVEAAAIVDICRQVEGLPLALELAAAWTRVLSCEAIAAELREGTELLRAVDPARPARHASIELVFDQSCRLLTATERGALSRLSAFRGGFTAEAARAVAGAPLAVIGALVDKSLLRKDGARAFLHPLVHQLAAERLDDGDARTATGAAHAHYYHRLLVQLRRAVEKGDRDGLRQIDADFENCRAAWRWSVASGQAEALARSMPTLLQYCDHRGRFDEGLSLLRDALESGAVRADPRFEPLFTSAVAHLEYRLDRYAEACEAAMRALAATRDRDTRLQCQKVLGSCCLRLGRLEDARRHYQQALKESPASTDPHNAAATLGNLALVEKALGRYDESLRLAMQSLVQYRRLGNVAGEALCLSQLGTLQMDRGEHDAAATHFKAGLDLCDRHGLVSTRGFILANLTELAMKAGDTDTAESYGHRALEVAALIHNRANVCWLELQFVRIALRRGDPAAARNHLRTSLDIAMAIGRPSLQLAGVCCFAEILVAQGERDCARRVLAFAAGHPSMIPQERDDARERLAKWGAVDAPEPAWPGIELGELIHRIVVETDAAHAPLIASIRGA